MWIFFAIWFGKRFAISIGQIQAKLIYELMDQMVCKLQVHELVLVEFAL